MRNKWILLLVGCVLMACDKQTINFSYSPLEPKAGESIQFTNLSTSGEEWEWTFGDASTSTGKNPTKIYKQSGTYTVTLKVDDKANKTVSKSITIYDTIPNFTCSIDNAGTAGIPIFEDVTFTAMVYNPYNYAVEYQWTIVGTDEYKVLSSTTTGSTLKMYFSKPVDKAAVRMKVTLNNEVRETENSFQICDVKTNSVMMMTKDSVCWYQRVFGDRAEAMKPLTDSELQAQLKKAQDSTQLYNGKTFTLADMKTLNPGIKGFVIAARKVYFRTADGIFVANIDGSFEQPIWTGTVFVECADVVNNRLYWAVKDSVMYMPLIGSENNKFTTVPSLLNKTDSVMNLLIDKEKR